MWRRISHALAWVIYGNSKMSLCAEMARRRAACRFCRCVCRALEFIPTFGPGHCEQEMEMYDLGVKVTDVAPGPLDKKAWKAFQKRWSIQDDGLPYAQTAAQVRELEEAYWRAYDAASKPAPFPMMVLFLAFALGCVIGSIATAAF